MRPFSLAAYRNDHKPVEKRFSGMRQKRAPLTDDQLLDLAAKAISEDRNLELGTEITREEVERLVQLAMAPVVDEQTEAARG